MTTTYTVPTAPTDVEAAALELIVRLPPRTSSTAERYRGAAGLRGVLHAEGVFAGLSWADAKAVRRRCRSTSCSATTRPTVCATGRAMYSRAPTP